MRAYHALKGVIHTSKDAAVIEGYAGRYGEQAVLDVIRERGPNITAAHDPLLYLGGVLRKLDESPRPPEQGAPGVEATKRLLDAMEAVPDAG